MRTALVIIELDLLFLGMTLYPILPFGLSDRFARTIIYTTFIGRV